MAYLGNAPARSFISFERQVFTIVNSQTAYALSHSVANENDIRLVVNNVVQEPGSGKAYTATGTALTLSAALTNGTDEMYCVFLGRATATSAPGAGSIGTSQLADDAVTTAKILNSNITVGKMAANSVDSDQYVDASIDAAHLNSNTITGQTAETSIADGDTLLIHDASASALRKMTKANFVSGIGGDNLPTFFAYMGSNQSINSASTTTLAFNTESWDTGNGFNTSTYTYTIPSGMGGYWNMNMKILFSGTFTSRQAGYFNVAGSDRSGLQVHHETVDNGFMLTSTMNLTAGQAVKVTMYQDSGSARTALGSSVFSEFSGFRLVQ
jgi:hypothetical protein